MPRLVHAKGGAAGSGDSVIIAKGPRAGQKGTLDNWSEGARRVFVRFADAPNPEGFEPGAAGLRFIARKGER